MLAAAKEHLLSRDQPDLLTAHFEYPARTAAEPAIVVIEDVKLSQPVSILHLTLWQGGLLSQAPWITPSVSRRIVLAYVTFTNLSNLSGLGVPTGYEVSPGAALPPLPDFESLKSKGADDEWEEQTLPKASGVPMTSLLNWRFYFPRGEPLVPGMLDMWICLRSGERITQGVLPYVVDSFPFNLHTYLVAPEVRKLLLDAAPEEAEATQGKKRQGNEQRATMWFPTMLMNLEVKMVLPEEGVEWLAMRVTSKQIRDGKFDLDVMVRDVEGELVALSHQVAMIVAVDKNTKKREKSAKAAL